MAAVQGPVYTVDEFIARYYEMNKYCYRMSMRLTASLYYWAALNSGQVEALELAAVMTGPTALSTHEKGAYAISNWGGNRRIVDYTWSKKLDGGSWQVFNQGPELDSVLVLGEVSFDLRCVVTDSAGGSAVAETRVLVSTHGTGELEVTLSKTQLATNRFRLDALAENGTGNYIYAWLKSTDNQNFTAFAGNVDTVELTISQNTWVRVTVTSGESVPAVDQMALTYTNPNGSGVGPVVLHVRNQMSGPPDENGIAYFYEEIEVTHNGTPPFSYTWSLNNVVAQTGSSRFFEFSYSSANGYKLVCVVLDGQGNSAQGYLKQNGQGGGPILVDESPKRGGHAEGPLTHYRKSIDLFGEANVAPWPRSPSRAPTKPWCRPSRKTTSS